MYSLIGLKHFACHGDKGSLLLLSCSPFKTSPDSCVLGVAESIQIDITFEPLKTGDFESNMVISYDTGQHSFLPNGSEVDTTCNINHNHYAMIFLNY